MDACGGGEVTFLFQFGALRDGVSVPVSSLTLGALKHLATEFINEKLPDNGMNRLTERVLLFRHDYSSPNVLQLINCAADVVDETLVEIVLTAAPIVVPGEDFPLPQPHALSVHSYKVPTFCDYCGEMLFGLVRQGLKCEGCGLDYHKRCAVASGNCTAPPPPRPSRSSLPPAASANNDDNSLVRKLEAGFKELVNFNNN